MRPALAGAAPWVSDEIEQAASLAERLTAEWGPRAPENSEGKQLARMLHNTVPVIAGAELAASAAYRWKCQFNENTGIPAFASVLPEADHNEVVGWAAARHLGRLSYVSLEDPGAHRRNALRSELTAALAEDGACVVTRVKARGETPLERLVSLVLLGDLVSIYAAVLRGADPVEIPAINTLEGATQPSMLNGRPAGVHRWSPLDFPGSTAPAGRRDDHVRHRRLRRSAAGAGSPPRRPGRLEYRGYDSAGISIQADDGRSIPSVPSATSRS